MFKKHPIIAGVLVSLLVTSVFGWWAARDGSVTLPDGTVVDVSAATHSLLGRTLKPLQLAMLQSTLQLPEGFSIEVWATGIPNARLMLVTDAGDLLVSSPREGRVYLVPRQADGAAGPLAVLLQGLDRPHGLTARHGWLYLGVGGGVQRIRFDAVGRTTTGVLEDIVQGLPEGGSHWTRTVHVGPDDRLYLTVGSSCNVCEEPDPRRAAMLRFELDGSGEELYATGLRNTVDFAWHPETGLLYGTDNGRDLLGDDFPPCELNQIVQGGFYGWPYVNGFGTPDPDYGAKAPNRAAAALDPVHGFTPHSAPLGMAFYDGTAFPARYRGAAFVALHGSWNRTTKSGYEVVALHFSPDGSVEQEPFITGFEIDGRVSGRPVGVAVGPAGELYVSDDYTGSVYRIVYGERESRTTLARGQALWTDSGCAACHEHAEGGAPPVVLADLGTRYDVPTLQGFLKAPQPPMPLYPFSDEERNALSVYLLSRFGG